MPLADALRDSVPGRIARPEDAVAPATAHPKVERVPAVAGYVVLGVSAVVLTGWALQLPAMQSFVPGLVTMKANTAFCLGLAAIALLLWCCRPANAGYTVLARGLGVVVALVGFATILEYAFGRELGIDEMLFRADADAARAPHPGRMALTTALTFLLLGASQATLGLRTRADRQPAQWLALSAGSLGLMALLAYAYGVIPLRGLGQGIQIALHTAVAVTLLAAGIITSDTSTGWMKTILSPSAGGMLVRRLLPIAFVAPVVVATLRPLDAMFGLSGVGSGSATVAVATMLVFAALIWRTAAHLEVADRERQSMERARLESTLRAESERVRAEAERHARLVAEEAMREKQQALAVLDLVLDSTPAGFALLDTELRYVRINQSLADILGTPATDYLGHRFAETAPHLRDALEPLVRRVLATGMPISNEEVSGASVPRTEQRHWLASVYPVRSPGGGLAGLGVMLVEETERRRLQAQLRQSQKMDAVGQLAGGIAHDFNNLLTVILGYAQLMLLELTPEDGMHASATEIQSATLRAAALTRQLLAFSRQQVLQPRVLELNDTVRGIEEMLRRLVMTDVVVDLDLADDLASVRVDQGQLEQVLMNLAVNGRDAMPDGGRLTITTRNVELDELYARSHGVEDIAAGSYVMLSVGDTGTGMSPETQARIFDPFFTTKEVGKGTGLGLATVYGIVKQSNGFIWCYSELGLGSTFRLYFPRVAGAHARAITPAMAMRAILQSGERILLVEDDDALRVATCRFLERAGYVVSTASGGAEALAMLADADTPYDLVISDVIMPNMNGGALAEALRAASPGMRVLLTSGFTQGRLRVEEVLDEGMAFLEKPFTLAALSNAVCRILHGDDARAVTGPLPAAALHS
jgi:two-component system cell cycle sensor histidine kinase/response regulator CckA